MTIMPTTTLPGSGSEINPETNDATIMLNLDPSKGPFERKNSQILCVCERLHPSYNTNIL